MVSTPEAFNDNSPISHMTPTPVNKPSAGKLLCIFTKILDAKKKTATRWFGADKSNHKENWSSNYAMGNEKSEK